jgi:hypothetical protein
LECLAETPFGSSDLGNVAIPPPAQKTFDAEGEILEHALTKYFRLRSEAIKGLCSSVTPISGRHHQGRMQIRLSARSSGIVESIGSGGRSDPELKNSDTGNKDRNTLSYFTAPEGRSAEELSLRVDRNREHLRRWLPWLDGAKDTSDQLKFIQRCSKGAAAGTAFHYALLSGGEIVGMVSFNSIEKLNRCATMGYGRRGRNRGMVSDL